MPFELSSRQTKSPIEPKLPIKPASTSKLSLAFPVPSTSIGITAEKPSVPASLSVASVPALTFEVVKVEPAGSINFTL